MPLFSPKVSMQDIFEDYYKKTTGKITLADDDYKKIILLKHEATRTTGIALSSDWLYGFDKPTEYQDDFYAYANQSDATLDSTNFYALPELLQWPRQMSGLLDVDEQKITNHVTRRNIKIFQAYQKALDHSPSLTEIAMTRAHVQALARQEDSSFSKLKTIFNIGGILFPTLGKAKKAGETFGTISEILGESVDSLRSNRISDDLHAIDDIYNIGIAQALDQLINKPTAPNATFTFIQVHLTPTTAFPHAITNLTNSTSSITSSRDNLINVIDQRLITLEQEGKTIQAKLDSLIQNNATQALKEQAKAEWEQHLQKVKDAEIATQLAIRITTLMVKKVTADDTLANDVNMMLNSAATIGFAIYKCSIGALQGGPAGLALAILDVLQNISGGSSSQQNIQQWCEKISKQIESIALRLGRMEVVQQEIVDRLKNIANQINNLDFNFSQQISVISDKLLHQRMDTLDQTQYENRGKMINFIERLLLQLSSGPNAKTEIQTLISKMKLMGEYLSRSALYTGRERTFDQAEAFSKRFQESDERAKFSLLPRALELLGLDKQLNISALPTLPDLTLWMLWATTFLNIISNMNEQDADLYRNYTQDIKNSLTQIKKFILETLSDESLKKFTEKLERDLKDFCDIFSQNIDSIINQELFAPLQRLKDDGGIFFRRLTEVLSSTAGYYDDFTDLNDKQVHGTISLHGINKRNVRIHRDAYNNDNVQYPALLFNDRQNFNSFFDGLTVQDSNMNYFNPEKADTVYYLKHSEDGKLHLYVSKDPLSAAEKAGLIVFEKDTDHATASTHREERGRLVFKAGVCKGSSIPMTKHYITIKHPAHPSGKVICILDDGQIDYQANLSAYQVVLPDSVVNNADCLKNLTFANIVHFALNHYFSALRNNVVKELKIEQQRRNIAEVDTFKQLKSSIKLELSVCIYLHKLLASMLNEKDEQITAELENLLEGINALPQEIYDLLSTENTIKEATPTHAGLRIRFANANKGLDILTTIHTKIAAVKQEITTQLKRHATTQLGHVQNEIQISDLDHMETVLNRLLTPKPGTLAALGSQLRGYFETLTDLPYTARDWMLDHAPLYSAEINAVGSAATNVAYITVAATAFASTNPVGAAILAIPALPDLATRTKDAGRTVYKLFR